MASKDLDPLRYKKERKRTAAFIIDETIIQIGNQHFWLWICIEPFKRSVLGLHISEERNMFVAENFIRSLVSKYSKHTVYTDDITWHPQTCNVIALIHYLQSSIEKSMMDRVNQYLKDRKEGFDDYYPCIKEEYNKFMYITGYNSLYLYMMIL